MGLALTVVGCLMAIAAIITITGMTVADIRSIRIEKEFRKHPHSRRFRKRPLLSIIIHDNASDECVETITRITYRKTEIIFSGEEAKGDLLLFLKRDTVLDPDMINSAVQHFNSDTKLDAIELLPAFTKPDTIRELFQMYRSILLAPFIPARAAFHAVPHWTCWPVMIRRDTKPHTARLYISRLFRWFALSANAATLLYTGYLAVALYEPFFFTMYLYGLGAWTVVSISSYPYFSPLQKIWYILLSPVAFGYFLFRALRAPLNPFLLRTRAAISRTSWRSYGQPMA